MNQQELHLQPPTQEISAPAAAKGGAKVSAGTALRPFLPVLLLLFVGSGCAALIYEVVWFQLMQLAIGSTAISLGVLLGTYMGGMCVGSLLLSKYVSLRKHPVRVFAMIECGIGVFGILVLWTIPFLDNIYAAIASHGMQGPALRAVFAAICLIPPTLLMGASLPAISRWLEATPEGVSWIGFLYGGNLAGAVAGCLLAGFYLLRVFDMPTATYVAAAINGTVALSSWWLAKRTEFKPSPEIQPAQTAPRARGAWVVYAAVALSGMTALGAEVVWTRLLSIMIGATVYTFSIILAVFLVGLGIGSGVGSMVGRKHPRAALGWCQLLLAAGIGWAAFSVSEWIPYWPILPSRFMEGVVSNPWINFQVDLARCLWTILPPAILWGASFPLGLAAASAGREEDPGKLVGETYAANTIGAILGALSFSLLFVPWLGTQNSQRLLILLAVASAVLVLMPMVQNIRTSAVLTAGVILATVMAVNVDRVPWVAVAHGRNTYFPMAKGRSLYFGEGRNASIVVSETKPGQLLFHVSGKAVASNTPGDMRVQRMLGHLPALINPHPQSVLIVGFGAGVTAGSFVSHPEIQKIDICEIEKLIPPTTSYYFNKENHNVLNDPRTTVHYDDARHYVLTTQNKYDVITSDPIHPWVKGAATLYSKEYFETVKDHLNPGGVVAQWVPLYESDPDTIKTELATFFAVFPSGTVWANSWQNGYDVVLIGRKEDQAATIDLDQMARRWMGPVAQSLAEVGFASPIDLMATYAGRNKSLKKWFAGAHINTDMDLRLQYMAGLTLDFQNAPVIRAQMAKYYRYPKRKFTGSTEMLDKLQQAMP
jgi:spermidine synthase